MEIKNNCNQLLGAQAPKSGSEYTTFVICEFPLKLLLLFILTFVQFHQSALSISTFSQVDNVQSFSRYKSSI